MKVRKKEIKVPKNFFVSRWRIPIFYGDIGDFLEGNVLFLKKVHSWGGVTEMVLG